MTSVPQSRVHRAARQRSMLIQGFLVAAALLMMLGIGGHRLYLVIEHLTQPKTLPSPAPPTLPATSPATSAPATPSPPASAQAPHPAAITVEADPHTVYRQCMAALATASTVVSTGSAGETTLRSGHNARIGLVSGQPGGTYARMADDLVELATQAGLPFQNLESEGGADNLRRIASRENAAIGMSVSDLQAALANSSAPSDRALANDLRLLLPLYSEEVHLLVRAPITQVADLRGQAVAVGLPISGTRYTAERILAAHGVRDYRAEMLAPADGLCQLLAGQVQAWFFVAGKPVALLQRFGALRASFPQAFASLQMLPLQASGSLADYDDAMLGPADYDWLQHAPIKTLAARALLVAYNFDPGANAYQRHRCQMIRQLAQVLAQALPTLQANPQRYHPKWREVDLQRGVKGWQLHACAPQFAPRP